MDGRPIWKNAADVDIRQEDLIELQSNQTTQAGFKHDLVELL